MERQKRQRSTPHKLLDFVAPEGERLEYKRRTVVFPQGDPADSVFYILKGKVKLTVVSKEGKEAIIALLNGGSFSVRDVWRVSLVAWPVLPQSPIVSF